MEPQNKTGQSNKTKNSTYAGTDLYSELKKNNLSSTYCYSFPRSIKLFIYISVKINKLLRSHHLYISLKNVFA